MLAWICGRMHAPSTRTKTMLGPEELARTRNLSPSRREWLRAGSLGLLGLTLPALLRGEARAASGRSRREPGFGAAKSCLVIFLKGGPSQLDTFDMKPEAPAAIRGEFRPIASRVPGISLGEHIPLLARNADKFTIVRSLNHRDNNHASAAYE